MRRFTFVFIVAVLLSNTAFAADPAAAIGKARQALNDKQYDAAIQILQAAVPDAAALAEPQHSQALAALHFYTALAFNGLGDDDKTREELEQFFRFNPNAKALDPSRYDPMFVKTFSEVSRAPHTAPETGGSNFDEVYPGYANFRERDTRIGVIAQWGDGAELQLLGTPEEKRAWQKLPDDEARRAFVEAFWKHRDKTPETEENEYRKEFVRRAAFADETFRTAKSRGSLTDRGRVFVLIGPPRLIRQKPLTARDGAFNRGGGAGTTRNINASGPSNLSGSAREAMVNDINQAMVLPEPDLGGTVERWIFGRDQLPQTIPDAEVTFKFITQQGYGDHVLQRELMVNKVLADAATIH
jgi:GWxTD domain-containing protein